MSTKLNFVKMEEASLRDMFAYEKPQRYITQVSTYYLSSLCCWFGERGHEHVQG